MQRKISVLIVSPDEEQSSVLAAECASLGLEQERSRDGESGLRRAGEWKPHILFIWPAPGDMSAGDFVRRLREDPELQNTRIVLVRDSHDAAVDEDVLEHLTDVLFAPFDPLEARLRLLNLSRQISLAYRLHGRVKKLEMEKKNLSRYVSSDLLDRILEDETAFRTEHKFVPATILFFDIRDSTAIAEKLAPREFARFLEEIMFDVMDLIYGHLGSVNKFVGDGILATFGCPTSAHQDAWNAVKCSLQIRKFVQSYNDLLPDYLDQPLKAGIGIATGTVFAGTIGSIHHMEYTVLGDPVNISNRLQSLTKSLSADILIDEATRTAAGEMIKARKIEFNQIRGRIGAVDIYEIQEA